MLKKIPRQLRTRYFTPDVHDKHKIKKVLRFCYIPRTLSQMYVYNIHKSLPIIMLLHVYQVLHPSSFLPKVCSFLLPMDAYRAYKRRRSNKLENRHATACMHDAYTSSARYTQACENVNSKGSGSSQGTNRVVRRACRFKSNTAWCIAWYRAQ